MKIPRKKKKHIPTGHYCYNPRYMDWNTGKYYITPCRFYRSTLTGSFEGYCTIIKCEIDDQCKSCGVKY